MAVKPGDILTSQRSKYRVDALIGRGGMGHVFAATDLEGPSPPVAIKVVSRVLFDETLMARLHREAEAAARIRSDYVPRVLDVSDTDDREVFLVMERLIGEPLSKRMRSVGPLPWADVVQIGEDVLRGLIDAHTAGVVHRDLKPSNVFLARKAGRVRAMVLDFGVCKLDVVDTERLTGTGESIGTVAYMAPEQIRGASKVDDRADLYAFGVLVFEMVCARLPHDGPSQMAILASKLENDPAGLADCSRVPTPDGLDALVTKALTRDPAYRFASAQELLKAWRKLGAADVASAAAPMPAESAHDPHEAPTTVHLGSQPDATDVEGLYPIEPHLTQSALTHGTSLRRGGGGRAAVGLSAFALIAGAISVAAFFARGPDTNHGSVAGGSLSATVADGGGTSSSETTAVTAGSSTAAETPEAAPDPPAEPEPEPEPAAPRMDAPIAASGAAGEPLVPAAPAPRKSPPRPRTRSAASASKSGAPHITTQPRY